MMHMRKVVGIALLGVLGLLCSSVFAADKAAAETVATGSKVSIEYTLTLGDKKVIDSNVGKDPLIFEEGSHQVIPGMEKALLGMKKGQTKKLVIKPEDAYGPVNKEAMRVVDKSKLPPEAQKVGAQVQATTPNGQVMSGKVVEIKKDKATVDFNHPLAGKTLYFDVKILDIK